MGFPQSHINHMVLVVISAAPAIVLHIFMCFQADGVKNSSGQGEEAQTTSEGRTRSVRSLGTAELIRPQKLKYFESMYHTNVIFFLFHEKTL